MNDYLDQLSKEICSSCNLTAVGIGVLKSDNSPLLSVAGCRHVKSQVPSASAYSDSPV